jgi:hypothetical protein
LTWAAPETGVCQDLDSKQAAFHVALWADLAYNASVAQAATATTHLTTLRADTSVVFPGSPGYPAACTDAAAFVIAQALRKTCTEEVCHTVWVAGLVNFFTTGSTS